MACVVIVVGVIVAAVAVTNKVSDDSVATARQLQYATQQFCRRVNTSRKAITRTQRTLVFLIRTTVKSATLSPGLQHQYENQLVRAKVPTSYVSCKVFR